MLLDLDPVLFRLGTLTVRWYGVMMALSMMIGYYYLLKHGKKLGLREEFLSNLALLVVFAGIVGARAIYVLTNWSYYAARPVEMVQIWRGGLSFHGGLLGGLVAGKIYLDRHGISWEAADLVYQACPQAISWCGLPSTWKSWAVPLPPPLPGIRPGGSDRWLYGAAQLPGRRNPPPGFYSGPSFSYSLRAW